MQNILSAKVSIFILRISMGWLFFYAGITKVLDPEWSAAGYLKGAKTFSGFYLWLTSADLVSFISFINQWSLTLLGISLLLGIFVRLSSSLGSILMLSYYFPGLEFPLVGTHSYIVDEHIIYILVLSLFVVFKAGRIWGIDGWLVSKFPSKILTIFS